MTHPPLTHPEPRGYVSSAVRGLVAVLGLDGPLLREARRDLRDATAVLSGRRDAVATRDGLDGLVADLATHRRAVDRVDLLAARVQRQVATIAPAERSSVGDPSVEELLSAAEAQLEQLSVRPDPDSPPSGPPSTGEDEQPSATAQQLMQLVDRLGAVTGERADPDPLLNWLQRRLIETLTLQEVTLIEDDTAFDPARHQIVDTLPAEHPGQADRISSTVRPGYLYRRRVLRPQQVVLWQIP